MFSGMKYLSHRGIFLISFSFCFFASKVHARGYLPESVVEQLEQLSRNFAKILSDECDEKKCYPKGCMHVKHMTYLDQSGFLAPGIANIKPSEIKKNYVLSQADCSFTYEDLFPEEDLNHLKKRLAAKLNAQELSVNIQATKLAVYSADAKKNEPLPVAPEQPYWLRLVEDLRPHFFWMIGVILSTICLMLLIATFRLTRRREKTLEEEAPVEVAHDADKLSEISLQKNVSEEHPNDKKRVQLEDSIRSTPIIWQHITSNWLLSQDYPLLFAARSYLSSDIKVLPEDAALMPQKVEFQRFFKEQKKHVKLIGEQDFWSSLEGSLKIYQELDEPSLTMAQIFYLFSPSGLAVQIEIMPVYLAKVCLSFMDRETVLDVLSFLTLQTKKHLLVQLLTSDRACKEDLEESFLWLRSVLKNEDKRQYVRAEKRDHEGVKLYTALATSLFLQDLSEKDKSEVLSLFKDGPSRDYWSSIFYPSMLSRIEDRVLEQLVLEQKADALCSWLASIQDKKIQQRVLNLSPLTIRNLFKQRNSDEDIDPSAFASVEKTFSSYLSKKAKKGEIDFISIM